MKKTGFEDPPDTAGQWGVRLAVTAVFAITGLEKFGDNPVYWIHTFDAIGFGQWFRYFTGAWEIIGGLLFLVPVATTAGFGMLVCAMTGAMAAQVVVFHRPLDSLYPAIYLTGVIVAYRMLRRRNS